MFGAAARIRADGVDAARVIEEAARWISERGRSNCSFWLGPSTVCEGLQAALADAGVESLPPTAAMVLRGEPPIVPSADVREVASIEDYAELMDIAFELEDQTASVRDATLAQVGRQYASYCDNERSTAFLCSLDGVPVAAGLMRITSQPGIAGLFASAARKAARGKGCYRALVRARYEAALAAGCPEVVTQASPFSRPILERLGFEKVADVTVCLLEWLLAITRDAVTPLGPASNSEPPLDARHFECDSSVVAWRRALHPRQVRRCHHHSG